MAHWDDVYRTKPADAVSWYQPFPEPSIKALVEMAVAPTASLVDVGGGASTLVDVLLRRDWSDLTVLDISAAALEVTKGRLGEDGERVHWIAANIANWTPSRSYDVWHDRAVFHFLTDDKQRQAYRRALLAGTHSGSLVIMATFAPEGPERCSGLPVRRYDEQTLGGELGPDFRLLRHWNEDHCTPGGASQAFNWCVFERI